MTLDSVFGDMTLEGQPRLFDASHGEVNRLGMEMPPNPDLKQIIAPWYQLSSIIE